MSTTAIKKEKILLVEDTRAMQIVVQSLLGPIYDLTCVDTLNQAEAALKADSFSLLLLDVVLPDGDGFDFCEKLRKDSSMLNLPIIFLTSKNEVQDRVRGFNLGADDYVVKPLEPNEFTARVKGKLLRSQSTKPADVFVKGEFKIDSISQKAYLGETELGLTPIEYKLFSLFLKNEGQVYSRALLKKSVWGPSIHLSDHTVDTHVSSLRKKLGPFSPCLKSVVKTGYVFKLSDMESNKDTNGTTGGTE
jgi:two-component system, OmpR family, phosphate regulon response regulator PhoB